MLQGLCPGAAQGSRASRPRDARPCALPPHPRRGQGCCANTLRAILKDAPPESEAGTEAHIPGSAVLCAGHTRCAAERANAAVARPSNAGGSVASTASAWLTSADESRGELTVQSREIVRCDHEIMLATYALLTGRDPVDCKAVSVSDALLYLGDWETERQIIRNQEAPVMVTSIPAERRQLTPADLLTAVQTFWQQQPCSVCAAPDATCPHRAASFAEFEALMRRVEPNAAGHSRRASSPQNVPSDARPQLHIGGGPLSSSYTPAS